MSVVLARVDQRLIHGIVVTQWAAYTKAKRLMVVDDEVSQDETMKAGMKLSKPAGTSMSIISTDTAIQNFKNGKYDSHSVFILVKEPATLVKLIEGGVQIPKVNLGIITKVASNNLQKWLQWMNKKRQMLKRFNH